MRLDVLIVDDHAPMRMMLRAIFERSGADVCVREAANGAQALALLSEQGAHLVICDHSMPGMSGIEFVLRLRADPRQARARVLMLSGYGDPDLKAAAREAGADMLLVKPVQPGALLRAVAALMPAAPAASRA